MKQAPPTPLSTGKQYLGALYGRVHAQLTSPYTKLVFLAALLLICTQKEISFKVSIASDDLFGGGQVADLPPTLAVSEPAFASFTAASVEPSERKWTKRQREQLTYVRTHASAALEEGRKHGIPASITLAQGLLESGHGTSTLARRNNNHFGIKCFSKQCRKGHCSNHSDDHHKDFFRIFKDVRESYAAHSAILLKSRYKKLFTYPKTDYKSWARGAIESRLCHRPPVCRQTHPHGRRPGALALRQT